MRTFLGQVERLLERALEVPAHRFFRTRLQPVELARALGRTMVAEGQIGPSGRSVPNDYVVELHPSDFACFTTTRESLERDLATYVQEQAERRGWACEGFPTVELRSSQHVASGRPRIVATRVMRDVAVARAHPSREPMEHTSVLPPAAGEGFETALRDRRAWLELESGQQFELGARTVSLGRAIDNDVVLDHESVSRHHAEIRRGRDGLVITDLRSTNGTRVNGRPIRERVLAPDATIHIGAIPMRLRVGG